MGAWKKVHFSACLIFAGNGFGQNDSADMSSNLSDKIKWHSFCRLLRASMPIREVQIYNH